MYSSASAGHASVGRAGSFTAMFLRGTAVCWCFAAAQAAQAAQTAPTTHAAMPPSQAVPSASQAVAPARASLVGRWQLKTVNGAAPPRFLAGTVLVLQADGQLVNLDLGRTGTPQEVNEAFLGKALREALVRGTWRAEHGRVYLSNSPRKDAGSAYRLDQQGRTLVLDPDPYLAQGDTPSKATYERIR